VAGFCLENTTQQKLANELLFGMFVMERWKKCTQNFIQTTAQSWFFLHSYMFQLPIVAIGREL
jgi:hypothetical protein